jgi:hypothetical protein
MKDIELLNQIVDKVLAYKPKPKKKKRRKHKKEKPTTQK